MTKTITLPENHSRVLSSRIQVIERCIDDIERMFTEEKNSHSVILENDIPQYEVNSGLLVIKQAKELIAEIFEKYQLKASSMSKRNSLNAAKATMWEILCDANSKGLRGYGIFPAEYSIEFDSDINKLQELIEKI